MNNNLQRSNQQNLMTAYTTAVHADQQFSKDDLKVDVSERIQFKWRDYDRATVAQIKQASIQVMDELFGDLFCTIDEFYKSFRVARVNAHGMVQLDSRNRMVWALDERGRYVEQFDAMTGQDIEFAILKIQQHKIEAAQRVNDLFLEALFAKHLFDDAFHERYESLLDGTIADRTARATRDTKQDKYFAYFKFYLYQQSEVLFSEIGNLLRLLERVRQWRVSDRYNDGRRGET